MKKKSKQEDFKPLALFAVITTEVVVLPLSWVALFYWLAQKYHWNRWIPVVAGLAGLIVGFLRIYQQGKNDRQR